MGQKGDHIDIERVRTKAWVICGGESESMDGKLKGTEFEKIMKGR